MDMPDFTSRAADLARSIVRSVVLGLLDPWDTSDLDFAIQKRVMLATLLKANPEAYARFRDVGKGMPTWASYFSLDYCLHWLVSNRPDLADRLNAPDGTAWLNQNIEALKNLVWSEQSQELTSDEWAYLATLYGDAQERGVVG